MIRERGWECFASYHDELAAGVVADYLCKWMAAVEQVARPAQGKQTCP